MNCNKFYYKDEDHTSQLERPSFIRTNHRKIRYFFYKINTKATTTEITGDCEFKFRRGVIFGRPFFT